MGKNKKMDEENILRYTIRMDKDLVKKLDEYIKEKYGPDMSRIDGIRAILWNDVKEEKNKKIKKKE